MAISEAARHDLYTGLRDVIGPESAETLMSAIPLHDLDEVVTKADLRAEIAELRTEMRTGFANLDAKIEAQQANLNTKIEAQQANLNTKIEAQQAAMYRHVNRMVVAVLVSIVGAVLGVGLLS